jgi:A118 family predicted phage portal protein
MLFSSIWNKIKEIISTMMGMNRTIEQTLHIVPAVSNKMTEAIDLWTDMYEDHAPWLKEPNFQDPVKITSLGLPAFIASEKARMTVLELKSEITAPKKVQEIDNPEYFPPVVNNLGMVEVSGQPKKIIKEEVQGPVERANYMNTEYKNKLIPKLRTQIEYGIAKGSLIIKPYVTKLRMQDVAGVDTGEYKDKYVMNYDFVQADCFYPFAFDASGNLCEVAFLEPHVDKEYTYTRVEYHKLEGSSVTIINRAFQALTNNNDINVGMEAINLGREIPLSKVPAWKDIPKEAKVNNVDRLLFGYFKMPDANTIDPHSPLGISGFARAKDLIKEADLQYSRLLWEFEGGQLAIDIDRDALTDTADFKGNIHSVMGNLQQRLYRPIDLGQSDTYKPYNPSLRDNSLINGLNSILMRIEDVCAMSRGTISDSVVEARTATELKILRQRSYSSIREIQAALETALRDVVYTMDVYCTLYNIVGDTPMSADGTVDVSNMGQYDVSFTWDDSILVDAETELTTKLTLLDKGITSKTEIRMWYYGESERQATDAINKIQDENRQAIEQNMQVSSQMGQNLQAQKDISKASQNGEEPEETTTAPNTAQDVNELQSKVQSQQ